MKYHAYPNHPYQIPSKYSKSLLDLSDDLIFGIAFSGYLGYYWRDMIFFMSVCTRFHTIGLKYISTFMIPMNFQEQKLTFHDFQSISTRFLNIVYFDTSFSSAYITTELVTSCLSLWKSTLRGLNFRATNITSNSLKEIFSDDHPDNQMMMEQILSLDVSKETIVKRLQIVDEGLLEIFTLFNGLRWLNLAGTGITDKTLLILSSSCLQLQHLNLQCCTMTTNEGIKSLACLSLQTLDISCCSQLSALILFPILFDLKQKLSQHIIQFACSYIQHFESSYIPNILMKLPRLKKIDCRTKQNQEIPHDILRAAKEYFQVPILRHEDQVTYLSAEETGIIPLEIDYKLLWPMRLWPYIR